MSLDTARRSVQAFNTVMQSGLIQKRAAQVYWFHYKLGALSKREMYEQFKSRRPDDSVQVDSFGPRYAQLVAAGLMEEVGERVCSITGQTVTVWDVTTKVPTCKLPKVVSEKEQLKIKVRDLQQEVCRLNEFIEKHIDNQTKLEF